MKKIERKTEGRHRRWINLAHKLAFQSSVWPYRMGCVVVRGGRVIATSVNRKGSGSLKHSAYEDYKGIHAELGAILQLNPAMLRNATVYVSGLTKGDNFCYSRPCESCQEMLKQMGVKCAVFHTNSGELLQECYNG